MPEAVNLTCEYKVNPVGVDVERPRFSWQCVSEERMIQGSYRLQVFKEGESAPIWDTGRVNRRDSVLVPYEGPALLPRSRYLWRVRIWDKRGRDGEYSAFAFFETGMMNRPFTARFIGLAHQGDISKMQSAPRLRREFDLGGRRIKQARLYATALGVYAMRLNGRDVSADVLSPGWTDYKRCVQYQTWDVTQLLNTGKNALCATLADGWYRGHLVSVKMRNLFGDTLALLAELRIVFEDGSEELIVTDERWKTLSETPIRHADYYMGIEYDARMETPGWDEAGFDDSCWAAAEVLRSDMPVLRAQADHPVRRQAVIAPIALMTTPKGERVLDLGQNMVGWLRFRVKGPAGTRVSVSHAEVLDKDGNFYNENYRGAASQIGYTLSGNGWETFEPMLTFFGFRYVRLENWPCEIDMRDFAGIVISSDIAVTSGFGCSDERVNQLFHNIQWGQRGNFVDVPTDCPQRDERLGWTGDCQAFSRTACINMDSALMLSEWLKDLSFDQRQDGAVPYVVPHVLGENSFGGAAWGDAATVVPWTLYQCYDDKRVLENQYPSMRRWLKYIATQSENDLWVHGDQFGDWLGLDAHEGSYVGATDKTLIATAFYAHSTYLTMRTAEVLGYEKDAIELRALLRRIVRAYRREFITPNGRLAVRTQTAYALTLHFDLAEEQDRARMVHELVELIDENGGHLTTGFVGTPYLCLALTEGGAHEAAGRLLLQSDYPSWLYSVTRGATTMWEHWDGVKPDGSFWSRDMNSFNHYAYGAIGEWMIRALAGIDLTEPGYRRLLIHPRPIEGLSFVSAWQKTPYGRVSCEWRIEEDGLHIVNCNIPCGTTAVAVLEQAELCQVTDGEKRLSDSAGVVRAWQSEEDVMLELESGSYAFKWRNA